MGAKMKIFCFCILITIFSFKLAIAGESFQFAKDAIEGLFQAKLAKTTMSNTSETDNLKAMTDGRIAVGKLKEAQSLIAAYASSSDGKIAATAKDYVAAYAGLIQGIDSNLLIMEKSMNNEYEGKEGTIARQASENLASIDKSWKTLVYATTLLAHALVAVESHLNISKKEKEELMKMLETDFGEDVKVEIVKGDRHATDVAPAQLWYFLNQPWKTSEQQ